MKLQVEYLDKAALKPYANNAKLHPSDQIEQIKKSIKKFGFNDPIAIWHDNEIIEGHGRLLAVMEMPEVTEVPVIRLDDLSDEQRRAYMLAHNKLTMNSGFDVDILNLELDNILDIDMGEFGFDLVGDSENDVEVSQDEVPDVPEVAKTKKGDLFQLGKHRLICGDCTDMSTIERLMGEANQADITITSPPYGAGNVAKLRDHYVKGNEKRDSFYNEYDDDPNDWAAMIRKSYSVMKYASEAQFINLQMLADNKKPLMRFVADNIDNLTDVIVWDKMVAPPQMQKNVLNNRFEFIFVFDNDNGTRTIPFSDFHGNLANIIELSTGSNEYADIHRAVYPVELPATLLNMASEAGTVFDPFGGTGTTMIACEQLNVKCYMCEIDPRYCDAIIERYEKFTGDKARKIEGEDV